MSESPVTVFVSRGRSVCTGHGPSLDRHEAGSEVRLSPDEAERLRALGFVQDTPPVLTLATAPNPAHIGPAGPVNVQGPVYRR
jgi:hypothetical protein